MAGVDPYAQAFSSPTARPAETAGIPSAPPAPAAPAPTADPYAAAFKKPAELYEAAEKGQHKLTKPFDQTIRNAGQWLMQHGGNQAIEAGGMVNTVLGAPQRLVAGAITGAAQGHGLGGALAEAGHSFMTSDPRDQAGMERALHADKLKVEHPSQWYDYARNAAVDFGAQTVTDPLTITPIGWIRKGEAALAAGARALPGATKVGEAVEKATGGVRSAFDPTRGVEAALGHEKATEFAATHHQAMAQAGKYLEAHPEKYTDDKTRIELQEKLARRIFQVEAPEKFGFNAEHYASKAKNLVPPKEGTHGATMPQNAGRGIAPANVIDKRDIGGPTMEEQGLPHPAPEGAPPPPVDHAALQAQADAQRVKYHQSVTKHGRATEKDYVQTPASIPAEVREALKDDPAMEKYLSVYDKVVAPAAVRDALLGQQERNVVQGAPKFLPKISNAIKDVMFLNPLPHIKNVATLTLQSPRGALIFARGMQLYAKTHTPEWKALADKMDMLGATSPFLKEREAIFKKVAAGFGPSPLGKIAGAIPHQLDRYSSFAHDTLWKFDKSMRIAMYEDAARHGLNDGEAAAYILDHLIDYSSQSPLAETLHQLGAPFPHWRIANPQRQLRGVVENPAGTERILRAQQDVNNQLPQNHKVDFDTPVGSGLEKPFNPMTLPQYMDTTMGEVWHEPLRLITGADSPQSIIHDPTHEAIMEGVHEFAPLGSNIVDALENPYHSKAPFLEQQGLDLIGAHPVNATSDFRRRVQFYLAHGAKDDYEAQKMALKSMARDRAALK